MYARVVNGRLLTGFVLLLASAARAEGLRITPPAVDLGGIRGGTTRVSCFELANDGKQAVEIIAVQPGCGCLVPQLDRRTLAPGEKATLRLRVRALGQPNGPRSWNVRLRCRCGPEESEQLLVVSATVRNEVTVEPSILALSVQSVRRHEITITDTRTPPLQVTAVHVTSSALTARREPQGRGVTKVLLDVRPELLAPGRHDAVLSVYTDDPQYSPLQVPITLERGGTRVVAVPARVRARIALDQTVSSTRVRLRPAGGKKLMVASVEYDDPAITATWAPGPDDGATLKVQIDGRRLTDDDRPRSVRVRLSEPPGEVLTIPVMIERE
jgi:hypothetical protein